MAIEITIVAADGSTRTTFLARAGTPVELSYTADAADRITVRADAPDPEPDPLPAPVPDPAPTSP